MSGSRVLVIIPAHDVPAFKPADTFVDKVKGRSAVKA